MKYIFFLVLFRLSVVQCTNNVVLVVVDGLKSDYLKNSSNSVVAPNLQSIINDGIYVKNITPEFPASTFPFLASLITGRHAQEHGILGNEVYDENSKKIWNIEDDNDNFWGKAREMENIWKINSNNTHHEPYICGRSAQILAHQLLKDLQISENARNSKNITSEGETSKLHEYDPEMETYNLDQEVLGWEKCINSTKEWLKSGNKGLVTIYVQEPGASAEIFGPSSNESKHAIEEVDKFIGNLTNQLNMEETDLIILSTPGFIEVSTTNDKVINLDKVKNSLEESEKESYLTIGSTPVISIKPLKDEITVFETFQRFEDNLNFSLYTKSKLPDEWFYDKEKVQPMILVAKEGYVFMPDFSARRKMLDKKGNREGKLDNKYGCSGYDNRLESMKTFMIAKGPSFKIHDSNNKDTIIQTWEHKNWKDISVVDVFSLLCHILNIQEPKESQGKLARLTWMLRYEPNNPFSKIKEAYDYATSPKNLPFAIGILAGGGVLIVCFMGLLILISRRKRSKAANAHNYRYTQVRHNRRLEDKLEDTKGRVYTDTLDDKESLLRSEILNDTENA